MGYYGDERLPEDTHININCGGMFNKRGWTELNKWKYTQIGDNIDPHSISLLQSQPSMSTCISDSIHNVCSTELISLPGLVWFGWCSRECNS